MSSSFVRKLQFIFYTLNRHRNFSMTRYSRTVNKTLCHQLQLYPRTLQIIHPNSCLLTRNFHTSCCKFEATQKGGAKNKFQQFVLRNWTACMLASGGIGTLYFVFALQQYKKSLQIEKAQEVAKEVGEAKVGVEDWELVDTDGNKFTNKDLHGKWCIFYFGFTHCPDICPDELDKLAVVSKMIEVNPKVPELQVVFVSVDPERDTAQVIKEYLSEFSKKFIGLTGTMEQVKHAGRQYRVYFSKGKMDEDGDYIVDHSIITYLVDPNGKFVEFYTRSATAMEIANRVEKKMLEHKAKNIA